MGERKPVVEFDIMDDDAFEYEYTATNILAAPGIRLASDSLVNLKSEIKFRRWRSADIACKTGCFSMGQNLVDEYYYRPQLWRF